MVVKITTQNVRSYECTIFCILFDRASFKIHDLHRSCWIAIVNHKLVESGNFGYVVPSNRDGASLTASRHNPFQ